MMDRMAAALEAADLETWSIDYPSTSMTIEDIARRVSRHLHKEHPERKLYAVTHSLGGIVLRHLKRPRLNWKRAVLIAPPNGGSAVAAALAGNPIFQALAGPAGGALGRAAGVTKPWPFPPCPFGIIAGTRAFARGNPTSWISGRLFAKGDPNDGTVTVEETKLVGSADHVTVDATHTTIVDEPEVQALTIRFLKSGLFKA